MPHRLAASLALLAFALCLLLGAWQADNPFTTAVWRALLAMAGTYVLGRLLAVAGQRMLKENLAAAEKNLRESQTKAASDGR